MGERWKTRTHRKCLKAERTAAAREQARLVREAEVRRRKRNGWLIRGGVLVASVAVLAVVALIVLTTMRNNAPIADRGPVPASSNAFGGMVFAKDNALVKPTSALTEVDKNALPAAPKSKPTAAIDPDKIGIAAAPVGQPIQVVAYVDFICEYCKAFESANASVLKKFQDQGNITLEYRPAGLLDGASTTNYSSRSAAAAACVADSAPEKYFDFFTSLYKNQPAESGPGLSNDQLKKYAKDVGADIGSCLDAGTYRPLVQYMTSQALAHGISSTPTVFVDGKPYNSKVQGFADFEPFVQSVIDAKK